MSELKYKKYVIDTLQMPKSKQLIKDDYEKYAKRILWLDDKVVDGAFHMNTAWYLKAAETLEDRPHTHDTDEIIGFFGNNPDDPYDLGGEIEMWMGDEEYIITRSTLLFVPAHLEHCPLILRRVDRPIFHFTTVVGGQYVKDDK